MEKTSGSVTRTLEVTNRMGIHARPAAMIVRVANKYNDTEVLVGKDEEEVNGKSIMGLMMLAAAIGHSICIEATGEQAGEAVTALSELVNRRFEEES